VLTDTPKNRLHWKHPPRFAMLRRWVKCKATISLAEVDLSCSLSLISPYLNWPHFIRTECAMIGRSHGELGRFTAHKPVRCERDQSHTAHSVQMKLSIEVKWDEMRWDHDWYDTTRCKRLTFTHNLTQPSLVYRTEPEKNPNVIWEEPRRHPYHGRE